MILFKTHSNTFLNSPRYTYSNFPPPLYRPACRFRVLQQTPGPLSALPGIFLPVVFAHFPGRFGHLPQAAEAAHTAAGAS